MKRHSLSKSSNEPFCLTREDVEAAFAFFDINGTGVLNSATLKARLEAFYPQLTSREYRFLLEDPEANTVNALSHSSTTPTSNWTPPASMVANSNNATRASTQTTGVAKTSATTANGTAAANRTINVPDIATAATNTCTAGNNSLNNTMNATMTTSAHTDAPFDVEQLWRIIDTFQQEYMIPSGATSGDAVSNATTTNNTTNAVHRKSKPHDESEVSVQETNNGSVKMKNVNESKSEEHASMSKKLTVASRGAHFLPSGETNFMFDPIQEAFQVYDPHHTNAVDEEVLSRIMASIGFGELSRAEISLLIRTADFDHDGKISLEDFRRLVSAKGRFQQKSDDKR